MNQIRILLQQMLNSCLFPFPSPILLHTTRFLIISRLRTYKAETNNSSIQQIMQDTAFIIIFRASCEPYFTKTLVYKSKETPNNKSQISCDLILHKESIRHRIYTPKSRPSLRTFRKATLYNTYKANKPLLMSLL